MTPKGADLAATDLIEVSTLEGGSYVTKSITGQELIDAIPLPPSGLTIGTTPIASGTIGRVLFQGTGNVLQQSSSLFWDSTNNRLGIGTSSPSDTLSVNGNLTLLNLLGTNRSTQLTTSSSSDNLSSITFYPATGTNVCQSFDIMPRGTGQANQKSQFSIWGTDFIANQTNYELLLTRATGVSYTFESFRGGTGVHRPLLFSAGASNQLWAYTSGNIGVNTTTDAGFRLDVNGTARMQTSLEIAGATGLTLGGGASVLAYSGNILNIGNSASWGDVRIFAGGVQKFSQTSSLTTIANTTINLSTATVQLAGVNALTYSGTDIRIGSVAAGFNSLSMYVAGSERARIASTGNLLINTTTDAGFKLDVNGTARVSGLVTANGYRITTNGEGLTAANASVGIVSYGGNGAASGYTFTLNNQYGGGNINRNLFAVGDGFFSVSALSSGTNTINWLGVYPVINNTGGTTTSRGIYYNPTLTNLTGTTHWAFHSTSGRIRFENLPTSPVGLSSGDLWNNLGILSIV